MGGKENLKNKWIPVFFLGIIILVMLFYSSNIWVNGKWSPAETVPPNLLLCDFEEKQFETSQTISNTTGLATTMISVVKGNSSVEYFSDTFMPDEIVSVGIITWSDGNIIAFSKKNIPNGNCVITSSQMDNFTIYGLKGEQTFPVIIDFRTPTPLDMILAENQPYVEMILGLLFSLGFSLVIVFLLSHNSEGQRKSSKQESK